MRVANANGRAVLVVDGGIVDIATASGGHCPGDLIFTGTPSGVGTRTPPRFLAPGDELVSSIEGIGTIRTHLVERSAR